MIHLSGCSGSSLMPKEWCNRILPSRALRERLCRVPQVVVALSLQQGIVGSAEDGLRLLERVYFASPRRFPRLEILQQPVTFAMERMDVLRGRHEFLGCGVLSILGRLEVTLQVGLRSRFFCDRLRVHSAFVGGIFHRAFIVGLR